MYYFIRYEEMKEGHKYLLQLTVSTLAAHTGSSHWVVSRHYVQF